LTKLTSKAANSTSCPPKRSLPSQLRRSSSLLLTLKENPLPIFLYQIPRKMRGWMNKTQKSKKKLRNQSSRRKKSRN